LRWCGVLQKGLAALSIVFSIVLSIPEAKVLPVQVLKRIHNPAVHVLGRCCINCHRLPSKIPMLNPSTGSFLNASDGKHDCCVVEENIWYINIINNSEKVMNTFSILKKLPN
jgi:hypothetical protein